MSWEGFGEHVGHHMVSGGVPQLDGSVLHVVFEEVPLQTDVLGLLADQGILRVHNGALAVLQDGGGLGDGGVKDLPQELPEVEYLLGGISRRVVLSSTKWIGPHKSVVWICN
jgi:hypothetical protein